MLPILHQDGPFLGRMLSINVRLVDDGLPTIQKESILLAVIVNKVHKCFHFELRLLTWQVLSEVTSHLSKITHNILWQLHHTHI